MFTVENCIVNVAFLFPIKICTCIFKETCDDQDHNDSDWKCCNDGNSLQVRHGIFGEQQCDRQQDQENRPKQFYFTVGFGAAWQFFVGISRCHHGDGIKGRGVKGYHTKNQQDQDKPGKRKLFQD